MCVFCIRGSGVAIKSVQTARVRSTFTWQNRRQRTEISKFRNISGCSSPASSRAVLASTSLNGIAVLICDMVSLKQQMMLIVIECNISNVMNTAAHVLNLNFKLRQANNTSKKKKLINLIVFQQNFQESIRISQPNCNFAKK